MGADKDKLDLIKRIKEEISRLDKATAKAYQDQLKGLDAINTDLDTYEKLLSNIKDDVADLNKGFAGILKEINSIVAELEKGNKSTKDATKAFRGLESIVQKLKSDQLGYNDLNLNQLKQEDQEAYLDERAGILPHFNRLKVDGITLYLVGEMGLIAKSNDFGRNWQKLDEVYHGSFFDITRTQQGNLLVCGLRGHVYRSEKNGTPWQEIKLETTALLNAIVLGGEDKIYILGNNGVVLESKNDANSFTQYIQSDGKSLIDGVWFNDKLIAVSDSGIKQINLLK